jgi:hypothetical protein
MPWKLAVEVKVIRSIPTRVFGGRSGRRIVGVGFWVVIVVDCNRDWGV